MPMKFPWSPETLAITPPAELYAVRVVLEPVQSGLASMMLGGDSVVPKSPHPGSCARLVCVDPLALAVMMIPMAAC